MNTHLIAIAYTAGSFGYLGYRVSNTLTRKAELLSQLREGGPGEFFDDRALVVAAVFVDVLLALVWPVAVVMDVVSWLRWRFSGCDHEDGGKTDSSDEPRR